jgi:hypothetical protein
MRQVLNILVLATLYAGFVSAQLGPVEKILRSLGPVHLLLRSGLSVVHAALGYTFLLGVVILLDVIVHGDYRQGILGPYPILLPICGGIFGFSVPWLRFLHNTIQS